MERPSGNPETHQTLSPSSSERRRRNCHPKSPEFEFWMVRNPSFPQPNLLSADELFVDGVLLPLHRLSFRNNSDPPEPPNPDPDPEPELVPGPEISAANFESTAPLSGSKRWKDIFKKVDKNKNNKTGQEDKEKEKEKEKKKERNSGTSTTSSSAELNINIWPFSRSRSAGNASSRPKTIFGVANTRKVNSAPCSRSNSAGESKSRKWPNSPGRVGVHLSKSSPLRQVRRGGGSGLKSADTHFRNNEKGWRKYVSESRRSKVTSGGSKARVLNLNVPMCIGYRGHLSCRSDENSALGVASNGKHGIKQSSSSINGGGDGGNAVGNLFNIRSLFTKKL